jgi:hypothetical protein
MQIAVVAVSKKATGFILILTYPLQAVPAFSLFNKSIWSFLYQSWDLQYPKIFRWLHFL